MSALDAAYEMLRSTTAR